MPPLRQVNIKNVKDAMDVKDIDKVWAYLGKKFGFNVRGWKNEFNDYFNPYDRDKSIQTQFMEFGKQKIEPILNDILCRDKYPTWIYLLAYLLKDKIEDKKKQKGGSYNGI